VSKERDYSDLTLEVFQCWGAERYDKGEACGFNGVSLSDSREECGHPLGDIEYAGRIAACVNACKGIPTEVLLASAVNQNGRQAERLRSPAVFGSDKTGEWAIFWQPASLYRDMAAVLSAKGYSVTPPAVPTSEMVS
jgi:hypothetical protein